MTAKLTFTYVYEYFKNKNCILLENNYENSHTKLKYKCKCNFISYIRFDDFRNGQYCKNCRNIKNSNKFKFSQEYVENYISSNNYILKVDTVYKNNRQKLELTCPNNHIIQMTFEKFKLGRRCAQCFKDSNIGENHPNWINDRTRKRRLDVLTFNPKSHKILNNDPNYYNFLNNRLNYHIDHIFPRVAFIDNDLDNFFNLKLIKEICNSRDNLRIILKEDNMSKNGKYDQDEFMNWFNLKLKEKGTNNDKKL